MSKSNITSKKNKKNIKINKAKQDLYDFMKEHKVVSKNMETNYVSFANDFKGKFFIPRGKLYRKFIKLYRKAIDVGVTCLTIAEKPKEYGPIKVDIDLEVNTEDYNDDKRLYDKKLVYEIIDYYRLAIKKYLDVSDSGLQCFLFEKPEPSHKHETVNDGVHMFFPNIIANSMIRHLIRDEVVSLASKSTSFNCYSNQIDKIFDKSIVSVNHWFLYGS